MALAMTSYWTSHEKPLCKPTLVALQRNLISGGVGLFGGCHSGGRWSWLAHGSVLEVVENETGNRHAAFQFGYSTGTTAIITCVKEYRYRGNVSLLVGLRVNSSDGMLCVFDPRSSKVVLALDIPHGVTAVEHVTADGGLESPTFALGDRLRLFFGIVAVGTQGGHTYLVDMRLDSADSCDEGTSRQSVVISPRTPEVGVMRERSASVEEHLCFELYEDCHSYRTFSFRTPDHGIVQSFPPSDVSVTCLAYIKQSGTLSIGFSFGCFQLWELSGPMLQYSSTVSKCTSPVTHFAYQEPEEDPQNFCYLWVGRGPLPTDLDQDVSTNLHLFQLVYELKENHGNYGHLYKDLVGCEAQFHHDLTLDPYNETGRLSEGSRLIDCSTLTKELSATHAVKQEDSLYDDEDKRLDLSLVVFVWEAQSDPADGQSERSCYIGVFDLNRWYYAQMPSVIRMNPGKQGCSFLALWSLESVLQAASPDFLMGVCIDPNSVVPYVSSHVPAPEQHLQPKALSFDVTCLMEAGVVKARFLGQQKQVLADLCRDGLSALREPQYFYNRCWAAGLLPRTNDQAPGNVNAQGQRESLLTVALEHNLLTFHQRCINSWTHGDFPSGCNLRVILDWSWGLVTTIKQSIDQICVPFYNGEGTYIDDQTRRLLNQYVVRLGHLITIIQSLLDQSSATTTEQGLKDLETKSNVVTLIHQHLKVLVWFVRSGLLPEWHDEQDSLKGQFHYPAARLTAIYARRRSQLRRMCRNNSDGDILMIDGLVLEVGPRLSTLWDRKAEGGTGLYPPPSFHALLDMYLVDTVPTITKHCIVGYFLLDLLYVSSLNSVEKEKLGWKIDNFCRCFSLPLGVTKLLHGFSLLDRKEFEDAINMLLDPTTTLQLAPWQHRQIIKSFLYQSESKKALQYVRTAQPPLTSREDVKLYLTVLIANGLTAEAFQFQRQYQDEANTEELLGHLILGSQQTKKSNQLLDLPFDAEEEAILEQYLLDSSQSNSEELLIMHYLQRARYVEAIRLNETLKQRGLMADADPAARERAATRNSIIESYFQLLPPAQRRLAFSTETTRRRTTVRQEVARPKPLSTVINPAKTSKVLSNATLFNYVLDGISEARARTQEDSAQMNLSNHVTEQETPAMEPFVGTPITPRAKSRFGDRRSSVIYPDLIGGDVSPWKRQPSPTKTLPSQLTVDSSFKFTDKLISSNTSLMSYSSASALTLLQTPPVAKRATSKLTKDEPSTLRSIPSILKVKSTSKRIPSEGTDSTKKAVRTMFDFELPSPPTFAPSLFRKSEAKDAVVPKRISFAEDTLTRDSVAVKVEDNVTDHNYSPDASLGPGVFPDTELSSHLAIDTSGSPDRPRASRLPEATFRSLEQGLPAAGTGPREQARASQNLPGPSLNLPGLSVDQTSPPLDQGSPPLDQGSPHLDYVSMVLAQPSPPLAQPSPPLAQPSPPLAQASPPLAQASPPLAQASPPLAQASPPLAHATPPPDQTTPPSRLPPNDQPLDEDPSPDVPNANHQRSGFTPDRQSPTSLFRLSREPLHSPSPPTEMDEGIMSGVLDDEEVTFHFGLHHSPRDSVAGAEWGLHLSPDVDANADEMMNSDSNDDDEEDEEEDIDDVDLEAIESAPHPLSFVPSPRRPLRPVAPDTAAPRLILRQARRTETPEPEDDDFVTPQQTPERAEGDPLTPAHEDGDENESMPEGEGDYESATEEDDPDPSDVDVAASSVATSLSLTQLQEIAVQTTPGLSLRLSGAVAVPTRVPFEVSLMSTREGMMTPPTSGEEMGGESSLEQASSQDEDQTDAVQSSEQSEVTMETVQDDVEFTRPMIKRKAGRKSNETTPGLPFIFSPPHTRSRASTRRHTSQILDGMMTPQVTLQAMPDDLPTVGQTPSLQPSTRVGYTPTGSTTPSGATPSGATPSGATPRGVTPSGATPRGMTSVMIRKDRRSHTPRSDETVFVETSHVTRRRTLTPVVKAEQNVVVLTDSPGPVTRSRRSLSALHQPPSDSPVNLLSPLVEEMDTSLSSSRDGRPKRLVRIAPHTMTLRTPRERKNRNVKLW